MTALPVQDRSLAGSWMAGFFSNPAILLLLSSNIANAGNFGFNIVFSRLAGPSTFADIAFLMTLKLSILSALNAWQFMIAQRTACLAEADRRSAASYIEDRSGRFIGFGFIATLSILGISALGMASTGNFPATWLLVFALSLPFMMPLILARGFVQGVVSTRSIVISTQAEMLVRFCLGFLFWQLGWGTAGVAAALVLAIIAGWLGARIGVTAVLKQRPPIDGRSLQQDILGKGMLIAALPWALLQLSQVAALDGEIITGKFLLSGAEAGYLAGASIIQRAVFFGTFALASLIVPLAARARAADLYRVIGFPTALMLAICGFVLGTLYLWPQEVVTLLLGANYSKMSDYVFESGVVASGYAFVYLVASMLAARNLRSATYVVFAGAVVQLACTSLFLASTASAGDVVVFKAYFQAALALTMGGMLVHAVSSGTRDKAELDP